MFFKKSKNIDNNLKDMYELANKELRLNCKYSENKTLISLIREIKNKLNNSKIKNKEHYIKIGNKEVSLNELKLICKTNLAGYDHDSKFNPFIMIIMIIPLAFGIISNAFIPLFVNLGYNSVVAFATLFAITVVIMGLLMQLSYNKLIYSKNYKVRFYRMLLEIIDDMIN